MSKVIPIKKRSTEIVVMESSFEKKMQSIKNNQLKKTQEIGAAQASVPNHFWHSGYRHDTRR